MFKAPIAALAVACAMALAACTPVTGYNLSQTSSDGWYQIAQGAGQIIGETKYDAKVAKASEQLANYCGALKAVALGATIFAPEAQRTIAAQAAAAVNSICAEPPKDVASTLTAAVKAYDAVVAASKASGVAVQTVKGGS
jgi:hypothetical protein